MTALAAPDEPPVTYTPGGWLAIVTDDLALLADVAVDSRLLGACWTAAVGGQGLDAALAALPGVADYCGVARGADGVRVVVAGTARAEVDGALVAAGDGGRRDETVPGRVGVRLLAETDAAAVLDEYGMLPMQRGIAPAAAVGVGVSAVPAAEVEDPADTGDTAVRLRPESGSPPGVLALWSGQVVPLDRDVLLGRRPTSDDAGTTLVPLETAGNDVSRNHARVTVQGGLVRVVDLGSTNGTVVTLPGAEPEWLRPHDPFTIVPGTTIALGHEVSMRYEQP